MANLSEIDFLAGTGRPLAGASTAEACLRKISSGKTILEGEDRQIIFSQDESANSAFYIREGRVKLTVVSNRGKEAVLAILEPGQFFGEEALAAGRTAYVSTATAMGNTIIVRVEKETLTRLLQDDTPFAEVFISHLVARNLRVQEDLIDQLFNSVEKRLARILLIMANYGKEGQSRPVIPKISQETLGQMIGADRSRVSSFMNKFKTLGFISYDHDDGLRIDSSLLTVLLHD